MSVYKVLVQKFDGDKAFPYPSECIGICADSFRVNTQETLMFHSNEFGTIAAFSCGTWYRVEKVEKCECGCDGTEAVEKAHPLPVQVW